MAQKQDADESSATPAAVIGLLASAADGDTLFRDLYLFRARELLAPLFAESRYRGAAGERAEAERSMQQARIAATGRDWERVRELSSRAAALQQSLQATQDLRTLAASIYDATRGRPRPLLTWSAGTTGKGFPDPPRERRRRARPSRGRRRPEGRPLRGRRAPIAALGPSSASPGASDKKSRRESRSAPPAGRGARRRRGAPAARRADARRLARDRVDRRRSRLLPDAARGSPGVLGEPFPQSSVERAGALGLEAVVSHVVPEVAATIRDFLDRYGWGPATAELGESERRRDAAPRALARERIPSRELADTAAETISLFATQVYVNSAGLRYVPLPVDTEPCLIEGFAEGEEPVTELLRALGLPKRRGLTRVEIENALLLNGPRVLEERLGFDPREFRLVCIPPDMYLRVGRERGWGQRAEWTHFDGYRVLQSGQLLALVGGKQPLRGVDRPLRHQPHGRARQRHHALRRRAPCASGGSAGSLIPPLHAPKFTPDGRPHPPARRRRRRPRPRASRRAAARARRRSPRSRTPARDATARSGALARQRDSKPRDASCSRSSTSMSTPVASSFAENPVASMTTARSSGPASSAAASTRSRK